MAEPHVSVIIPVHNEERYLAEAIQSVIGQDFDDLEVVVVDDGSTDRSAEIAAEFNGVLLIRQENAGAGAALNTGVANAGGALVAFLDADDFWEPSTLARRVRRFADDPGLEITHGLVVEFVSPELEPRDSTIARTTGIPVQARLSGTTMIRRTAFARVGPIDTELKLGGWMDWLMRAEEAGLRTAPYDELVLHRRIHDDNLGIRESTSRGDYVRLLKNALDRRRASSEPFRKNRG